MNNFHVGYSYLFSSSWTWYFVYIEDGKKGTILSTTYGMENPQYIYNRSGPCV